jgi:urease accessory protein
MFNYSVRYSNSLASELHYQQQAIINRRIIQMSKSLSTLIVFLALLVPTLSNAHPGHAASIDLISGITHPYSGLDHFLVILLVGFWSALAFKKSWLGPVSFMLGMTVGAMTGLFTATPVALEFVIAGSVIVTGILITTNRSFSERLSLVMLASFGVAHGLAHTGYLPALSSYNASDIAMDIAGLLASTALLHFAGLYGAQRIMHSTPLFAKLAGCATFMYGSFLLSQLALN